MSNTDSTKNLREHLGSPPVFGGCFCLVFGPVSCVSNVVSVSRLFIFDCPFGFLYRLFRNIVNIKVSDRGFFLNFGNPLFYVNATENRRENSDWTIQRHRKHWAEDPEQNQIRQKQTTEKKMTSPKNWG